jgi:dethiobiotin synthetase
VKGLFVTGTDTDAGKTVVTAALAACLRARGLPVRAAKPLATGEQPPGADAQRIAAAAGHAPLNLVCLPEPASPDRAAREAGTEIDLAATHDWLRSLGAPLLVEGVGGWEVPLGRGASVADLGRRLGLPVLIVAPNRLGVLNHVFLTVNAVRARGLWVAGVVLNDSVDRAAAEPLASWNAEDLRHADIDVVRLGTVPERGLALEGSRLIVALPGVAAALLDDDEAPTTPPDTRGA